MSTLYMLIGVPASGKSTWVEEFTKRNNCIVLSTDNYIQSLAEHKNLTYDEVFEHAIKEATAELKRELAWALKYGMNIIWDQTNLTPKSRRSKLGMIPGHYHSDYHKIAVVFPTPAFAEHARRLERPGKTIPAPVLKSMIEQFTPPTLDEGFDEIWNM